MAGGEPPPSYAALFTTSVNKIDIVVAEVVNGQKNTMVVTIENKSGQNVTLSNISGGLSHPITGKVYKNVRRCVRTFANV